MNLLDKDEKGFIKSTPKNMIIVFGGIFLTTYLIYKVFPWEFKKK